MRITTALKAFSLSQGWTAADATDDNVKSAVLAKFGEGKIDAVKLAELTRDNPSPGQATLEKTVESIVSKAMQPIIDQLKLRPDAPPAAGAPPIKATEVKSSNPDADVFKKHFGGNEAVSQKSFMGVMSKAGDGVRVVGAMERYSTVRKAAMYPSKTMHGTPHMLAGQPAQLAGRFIDLPSDADKAIAGAWFKLLVNRGTSNPNDVPKGLRMTEHDWDLVKYAVHEAKFTGGIGGTEEFSEYTVNDRKLHDYEVKALLDDSTSGGTEIVPQPFDDIIVTTPVLYGELFPLVNVINVTRGRRVKGGAISNPTITSAGAEGTAITAFTTTSMVSAFDTTIYNPVAAIEIGLDFEEDSPTGVTQIIISKYGEKMMEWLDEQIAIGDGTTEPQGVFNASSTTLVLSDNGATGPPTVSDYEGLMFGVSKAFRNTKGSRNVFIGNDTSYRRARGISVSPTDERRVFGMTHMDYRLLDHDYKIQNSIANTQIAFANLGYYRMYRRLGVTIRNETSGNYLTTRNLRLLVLRARFGGKMELGGAAAIMSDAQSA